MNHAPAVQYPVGRSVWALRLHGVVMTAWLLAQMAWGLYGAWSASPGAWWFSTFAGVLYGGWVWACLQRMPSGLLLWQPDPTIGGVWRWQSQTYRHGVALDKVQHVLDGHTFVLLKTQTAAGLHLWLWLEQEASPADWLAIRRALHAHSV